MCPFPDISLLWDYCETRIGCLSTHKSEQYDLKRVPFTKCQTHFVKKTHPSTVYASFSTRYVIPSMLTTFPRGAKNLLSGLSCRSYTY